MLLSSAVSLSANYVADYDACRINSSRVLDIHYPDRHLVALLIHNDYESDLRSQLSLQLPFAIGMIPLIPQICVNQSAPSGATKTRLIMSLVLSKTVYFVLFDGLGLLFIVLSHASLLRKGFFWRRSVSRKLPLQLIVFYIFSPVHLLSLSSKGNFFLPFASKWIEQAWADVCYIISALI